MDPGLDFSSLLGLAEHVSKDKVSSRPMYLKTKFEGPKREKKEKGKLNDNVRKFLEKKEADERKKEQERKSKLKNLQELRTESAKNKISKHLKVTKSANKAVISEAVNSRDTAVTMNGRAQCDEDDYGFTSGTSSNLYDKLMGKYEACPDDPMAKFSKAKPKSAVDIASAKERVKQALKQQEEPGPIQRKRRKKGDTSNGDQDDSDINCTRVRDDKEIRRMDSSSLISSKDDKLKSHKIKDADEASRRRKEQAKKAPKPMDFESLMAMAKTVKDTPVVVQKKKEIKEHDIGDRPMTKKQKEEYIRENEARLRREGKLPPKEQTRIPKLSSSSSTEKSAPEKSSKSSTPPVSGKSSSSSSPATLQQPPVKVRKPDPGPSLHPAVLKTMKKQDILPRKSVTKEPERRTPDKRTPEPDRKKNGGESKEELKRMQEEHKKLLEKMKEMEAKLAAKDAPSSSSKKSSSSSRDGGSYSSSRDGGSSSKSDKKRSSHEAESRKFPGEKQFKKKDKYAPKRNRIESDSEYDSEMDDFIDDTDAGFDISKEIRSIFGYDKRRFRDEPDFDDRSMENNKFSNIMAEEIRSAKIGRMEDLEDMRREEMEKQRKLKKLKSKKR